MLEVLKNLGVPKEVQIVRKWVETDIIGSAVCPPMVQLARQYPASDGGVDWSGMAKHVEITSHIAMDPESPKLVDIVASQYYKFMGKSADGNGPLTRMFILPDFANNPRFDRFARDMVNATRDRFRTNDGNKLARRIMIQLGATQGIGKNQVLQTINDRLGMEGAIAVIIQEGFNPAYFYGQALSNRDVSDMPTTRGTTQRQKMLSRAPYYMLQMVNTLASEPFRQRLNRERLHRRNTRLALSTDLQELEERMRRYRGK